MADTNAAPFLPLDYHLAELIAYHVRIIAGEIGRISLSARPDMAAAEIVITRNGNGMDQVWDQVTINGRWCGNRAGGAAAYVRLVAGDPYWDRPFNEARALEARQVAPVVHFEQFRSAGAFDPPVCGALRGPHGSGTCYPNDVTCYSCRAELRRRAERSDRALMAIVRADAARGGR